MAVGALNGLVGDYLHRTKNGLATEMEIVAAAQEERFTRVRHDAGFPSRAVAWCLAHAGIDAARVDHVCFYDKPITKFASLDDGFYDVVGAIRKAVKDFLGPQSSGSPEQQLERPVSSPQRRASSPVRSSNYALKRSFSELDRDNALQECFTCLAEFFENSLLTLEQRYPHLTCSFQRVDAKGFEAAIYENGKRRVQCGIWIDRPHGSPSIFFSSSGITRGSYNESASTEDDGTVLGFKLLGMATYLQQRSGLLTSQGIAECFWEMLIHPLQQ